MKEYSHPHYCDLIVFSGYPPAMFLNSVPSTHPGSQTPSCAGCRSTSLANIPFLSSRPRVGPGANLHSPFHTPFPDFQNVFSPSAPILLRFRPCLVPALQPPQIYFRLTYLRTFLRLFGPPSLFPPSRGVGVHFFRPVKVGIIIVL